MKNGSTSYRLQTAKRIILGLIAAATGIALIVLSRIIPKTMTGLWEWVTWIPFQEVGGTLFTIGLVGVAYDLYTKRDDEAAAVDRLRSTLKSEAPVMRDAVIEGFAFNAEDLKRVGTPELLDQLAENALALRFGDTQFAAEVYGDIRDQAIAAKERWYDVRLRVRLSTAVERNTNGIPLFDVTCTWEYDTVLSEPIRRFVCVSDRQSLRDYEADLPATTAWVLRPQPGVDASQRDSFEVVDFTCDGQALAVHRSAKRGTQTYSVHIPSEAADPMRHLTYTYRTVTSQSGGQLHFTMPVPARRVDVTIDYTDCPIGRMTVSDLLSSRRRPHVRRSTPSIAERTMNVDHDGWILPGGGFAFHWTLTARGLIDNGHRIQHITEHRNAGEHLDAA